MEIEDITGGKVLKADSHELMIKKGDMIYIVKSDYSYEVPFMFIDEIESHKDAEEKKEEEENPFSFMEEKRV